MDVLCGFHAKDEQTCKWVIENCTKFKDNLTVKRWVEASEQYLKSLSDGPAMVSIDGRVEEQTAR